MFCGAKTPFSKWRTTFKKSSSHPRHQNPRELRQMIADIATSTGWLYLAVVIDLCSRKIVGWALADHMRSELVTDALRQALGSLMIVPGWVFHSDCGRENGSRPHRCRPPHRNFRLHRILLQLSPQRLRRRLPKPGPIRDQNHR